MSEGMNQSVNGSVNQIIEWLKSLIEFNTTCDEGNPAECLDFIRNLLLRKDASALKKSGAGRSLLEMGECGDSAHPVFFARLCGKNQETILLHAHLDTAPYDKEGGWRVPAEHASVIKGRIFGRGALDCKSQAAVFLKLFIDRLQDAFCGPLPERSLMLLLTTDEETGGSSGLGRLVQDRGFFENVILVLGEGGGFPFPLKEKIYYTFQTGELEDKTEENPDQEHTVKRAAVSELSEEEICRLIHQASELGYYDEAKLQIYRKNCGEEKKKLDVRSLYEGLEGFLCKAPQSRTYELYGSLFETILRRRQPSAELMPVITPGFSDNRYFRHLGIPVIGFFPFAPDEHILMHLPNEYVSIRTLELAYGVMGEIIEELLF